MKWFNIYAKKPRPGRHFLYMNRMGSLQVGYRIPIDYSYWEDDYEPDKNTAFKLGSAQTLIDDELIEEHICAWTYIRFGNLKEIIPSNLAILEPIPEEKADKIVSTITVSHEEMSKKVHDIPELFRSKS